MIRVHLALANLLMVKVRQAQEDYKKRETTNKE